MDPLSPSNINAGWASSPPETPTSLPPPSAMVASSSASSFREPKIFGAPGTGLVNPPSTSDGSPISPTARGGGSEGVGMKGDGGRYLRVRIGGLERNRKDLLIRFDASTNLPGYRTTLYKNMQRSYLEFQRFAEQAQLTSPQTIIPALPLPTTSAVTDEEDDRLVRIALQKWFTRICEDPNLQRDEELRAFIESDFGYNPIPPPSVKRPISASTSATNVLTAALSKVVRRGPLDEDEELAGAKGALEKLEGNWGAAATSVGALGKARRAHALANQDVGAKLISLSTVESDLSLAAAERKLGRTIEQLSNMAGAQAASENVMLSDTLGYQALNAKSARAALTQRTQILEDSQTASKAAINKRRNVERLKGSSSINPSKVDDAIAEMDEANMLEENLSKRLNAISQHLHVAMRTHSRQAHEDVALALLENARLTIGYHKHTLREIEALRPDIARIGSAGAQAPPPPAASIRAPIPSPSVRNEPIAPAQTMSRGHTSPPRGQVAEGSRSIFLPPPTQQPPRPSSANNARPDPLGNGSQSGYAGASGMPQHAQQPYRPNGPPSQSQGFNQGYTNLQHGGPSGPGGYTGAPQPGYQGQNQGYTNQGYTSHPGMVQSMVLPGQHGQHPQAGYPGPNRGQPQTMGRAGARRLDPTQAAKLLAGGF